MQMVGGMSNSQDLKHLWSVSSYLKNSVLCSIFPATTKRGCTLMDSWAHLTEMLAGGEDIYIKIRGGDGIWGKIRSLALYILSCPSLFLCVSGANKSFQEGLSGVKGRLTPVEFLGSRP